MITLQKQFEKDFPDKGVRKISASDKYPFVGWTNSSLDLSEYVNLEELYLSGDSIASIKLTQNGELKKLILADNYLGSVDFLNQLPNPEKLEVLLIFDNNIQPTDISIFSKFVNLKVLKIGTMETLEETPEGTLRGVLGQYKRNRFYGSFKSWKNLTKLESICIEATDVDEGLEYLPSSLVRSTTEEAKKKQKRLQKNRMLSSQFRCQMLSHTKPVKTF